MPTYEYRCPKGHEFELFQKMSDEPIADCPECGKQAERLLSAGAGLVFKGSGFYITDYRNESYKKAADKDSPKSSDSKSSGSGDKSGGKSGGSDAKGAGGGTSAGGGKGD